MSKSPRTLPDETHVAWHLSPLPAPAPQHDTDHEYIPIAGHKAATDLWATLHELQERDDGSKRISAVIAAKRLRVSPKLFYRWLAGPTNMGIETAGKIAASMEADLHIVAIPWEQHAVQSCVHSFASARMISRTSSRSTRVHPDPTAANAIERYRSVRVRRSSVPRISVFVVSKEKAKIDE